MKVLVLIKCHTFSKESLGFVSEGFARYSSLNDVITGLKYKFENNKHFFWGLGST